MIRRAAPTDIPHLVDLAEGKRLEDQRSQPVFWRKAWDSRERHGPYLERLIADPAVIALVHEQDAPVDGFVIGTLGEAPPVYDPGGPCRGPPGAPSRRSGSWWT